MSFSAHYTLKLYFTSYLWLPLATGLHCCVTSKSTSLRNSQTWRLREDYHRIATSCLVLSVILCKLMSTIGNTKCMLSISSSCLPIYSREHNESTDSVTLFKLALSIASSRVQNNIFITNLVKKCQDFSLQSPPPSPPLQSHCDSLAL